jgi:hypothetical protein
LIFYSREYLHSANGDASSVDYEIRLIFCREQLGTAAC